MRISHHLHLKSCFIHYTLKNTHNWVQNNSLKMSVIVRRPGINLSTTLFSIMMLTVSTIFSEMSLVILKVMQKNSAISENTFSKIYQNVVKFCLVLKWLIMYLPISRIQLWKKTQLSSLPIYNFHPKKFFFFFNYLSDYVFSPLYRLIRRSEK